MMFVNERKFLSIFFIIYFIHILYRVLDRYHGGLKIPIDSLFRDLIGLCKST